MKLGKVHQFTVVVPNNQQWAIGSILKLILYGHEEGISPACSNSVAMAPLPAINVGYPESDMLVEVI